ncbi:helix-turn-helix domain-containing protein [Fusibacter tunisiensis]|uniref:Transcriptional regulator n=1 Tax=Fusibacter tunisiensis TaxID=1008308 RepID=A0ABS2MT81_9FIRM|nr:helix-turn-helix domain-containing protein [Fusibacter tunisiensis]MBM7562612.1 putative transcriptional regulator [Fusibacter tunisiensis]
MKKADIINKVYQLEISKRATLVVFYLINRADGELTCFPGIKTIARECNMSTRTVQRALGDLKKAGLVRKESRFHDQGGQRSNLYYLQMPEAEEMKEEVNFESYRGSNDNEEELALTELVENEEVIEAVWIEKQVEICGRKLNQLMQKWPDRLEMSRGDSHYGSP